MVTTKSVLEGTASHIVEETSEYIVGAFLNDYGRGTMTLFDVFPGMCFSINDFDMYRMPVGTQHPYNTLMINFCIEGRCEVNLGKSGSIFVDADTLSIDRNQAQADYKAPTGRYRGIELFIDIDMVKDTPLFQEFDIDIEKLAKKFCPNNESFLTTAPDELKAIFNEMARTKHRTLDYFRIKVLELFYTLREIDPIIFSPDYTWLSNGQIEIAESVYETLMLDYHSNITLDKLAKRYKVSVTSLRNYFQKVYGESISTVVRRKRIQRSKELLCETHMKVAEIAQHVGYENQSKFSAAFRKLTGDNPLAFRKKNSCKNSNHHII